jgi:hypothetical protein
LLLAITSLMLGAFGPVEPDAGEVGRDRGRGMIPGKFVDAERGIELSQIPKISALIEDR